MQMAYAAICSSDGKYILRLSASSTGLGEYILMLIPAAFLSFGIAFFASVMEAERFSQSITRLCRKFPSEMVRMDDDYTRFQFEKCPYEEINVIANTTTRMSRNMKKYLERIEKEKQIRQEFFSNASHELKTPITSIRGYVELLESGMAQDPDTAHDFLGRIKKEAMRMTNLVDDILMISRLESQRCESRYCDNPHGGTAGGQPVFDCRAGGRRAASQSIKSARIHNSCRSAPDAGAV